MICLLHFIYHCNCIIPAEIMGGVKSLGEFYLNTLCNEKEIDWVFFSPAGTLEPGQRTEKFRLGKDDLIVDENGNSHISAGITPESTTLSPGAQNKVPAPPTHSSRLIPACFTALRING